MTANRTNQHALLSPLREQESYHRIVNALSNATPQTIWASGVVAAQKWHLTSGVLSEQRTPALIIAPSELKAKEIYEDMYYFFRDACHFYPSRDLIFYAADVKSVDITKQRLKVLDKLHRVSHDADATPPIVILSAEALLDRMTPPETFHRYRMSLSIGDICEPEMLMRKLVQMGYERSSLAEGPGQFALRGGILDIYPAVGQYNLPNKKAATPLPEGSVAGIHSLRNGGAWGSAPLIEGQALRVEFFGDDVDSIRIIDALSQRSVENASAFEIYPVRELVFSKSRLRSAIEKIRTATTEQCAALRKKGMAKEAVTLQNTIDFTLENWSEELGAVSAGNVRSTHCASADAFLPFFYEEDTNLLDYLPDNTIIFFDDPNPIAIHMDTVQTEYNESISHRLEAGRLLPQQVDVMMPWAQVLHHTQKFHRMLFSSMSGKLTEFANPTEIPVPARSCMPLRHKPSELKQDIAQYLKKATWLRFWRDHADMGSSLPKPSMTLIFSPVLQKLCRAQTLFQTL